MISCNNEANPPAVNYSEDVVATPVPFAPGIIATEDNSEFELTFSADGRRVYFSRRAPGEKQAIYQTDFVAGNWSNPTRAPFSTNRDETAMITPNGKYLYFGSERPLPGKPNQGNFDMNIWVMEQTASGWGTPEPLPEPINQVQVSGEQWPSSNNNFFFSNDNETFYFTTMNRGSESIKLYQTTLKDGAYSEPEVITGLFDDEKFWVYSAVISPDGQYLVFNSYGAPGGAGGEDIFVSKRTETGWSKAKPIGPLVNTTNEESSPRFSRDGKYFFFSRAENLGNYEYGEWGIFFVETEFLNLASIHNP
ncbi:WD40-like Beta Propeller Repeat [Robiginitalea myxolifaciens]|uniref:WD40-like Beta Propeller Repeat n=1 Tax=Robiginitalea myxolifaciens TaxID=400055 RepID=A0A1I6HCC8_9FLAO|nr:PD40 domain-containing protein [Robiginitalea myxolifaciens]SFR52122.1 WD40-like Beta Propeller Repeat [Robiginitalea myxolifaciens]